MTSWETLGHYLGREVRIQSFDSADAFEVDGSLASSVVLVFSGDARSDPASVEALLRRILVSIPLAVLVSGSDRELAFDRLLEVQSELAELPHTMTGVSDATDFVELVEDFLYATWPAEERFDAWTAYSVLVFGEGERSNELRKAIVAVVQ